MVSVTLSKAKIFAVFDYVSIVFSKSKQTQQQLKVDLLFVSMIQQTKIGE